MKRKITIVFLLIFAGASGAAFSKSKGQKNIIPEPSIAKIQQPSCICFCKTSPSPTATPSPTPYDNFTLINNN